MYRKITNHDGDNYRLGLSKRLSLVTGDCLEAL